MYTNIIYLKASADVKISTFLEKNGAMRLWITKWTFKGGVSVGFTVHFMDSISYFEDIVQKIYTKLVYFQIFSWFYCCICCIVHYVRLSERRLLVCTNTVIILPTKSAQNIFHTNSMYLKASSGIQISPCFRENWMI